MVLGIVTPRKQQLSQRLIGGVMLWESWDAVGAWANHITFDSFLFLYLLLLYVCFACVSRQQVHAAVRRGCQIPWNRNYKDGCEVEPGPLKKQPVSLTAESSLHSPLRLALAPGIAIPCSPVSEHTSCG